GKEANTETAAGLLVRTQNYAEHPRQCVQLAKRRPCVDHRGNRRLHIGWPEPVEDAITYDGVVGAGLPLRFIAWWLGVDVAVERQDRPAEADLSDHVWPVTRPRRRAHARVATAIHGLREQLGHSTLVARRVGAGCGHQLPCELDEFSLAGLESLKGVPVVRRWCEPPHSSVRPCPTPSTWAPIQRLARSATSP